MGNRDVRAEDPLNLFYVRAHSIFYVMRTMVPWLHQAPVPEHNAALRKSARKLRTRQAAARVPELGYPLSLCPSHADLGPRDATLLPFTNRT